jgi:hypothetical protein
MKKSIAFVICLMLLCSALVLAEAGKDADTAKGSADAGQPEQTSVTGGNADSPGGGQDAQPLISPGPNEAQQGEQNGEIIRTTERLREKIQERAQQLEQEAAAMGENEQKVLRNQNQVRLAVHTLLDMKDMVGGIGPQVSAIAKEFNNSVQATLRAEEKIQTRSAISRFFAGGDDKAAGELEAEVSQNQARIQQLTQLKDQCECDNETKLMMQEQIQSLEQEQTRLNQMALTEKQSKGLLGWLWK